MLPKSLESAVRTCVKQAFCKKANSRKQMRAFLVKLAADKLQNAYKFAPRGSTTQRMSPVPGTPGREQLLRPSMAKKSADGQPAAPKLTGAPAAPKAPAMPSTPAAPKAPAMPSTPAAPKLTPDTQFDLKNMQNSPGTNFFSDKNPTYAAMRGPDTARLAPKPQMRPGMSNEINYGIGPSGESVTADIVPGGTMPVGRLPGRSAAEKALDAKFKGKTTVSGFSNQAAPDSPPLTQLLAGMTPSQRLAYKKQNVFNSPTAYANRNQIAAKELARRAANSAPIAPELAPVPIPEPLEAPPVSTPLPEMPAPESVPLPPIVDQQVTPQVTPQVTTSLTGADIPSLNVDPRAAVSDAGRFAGQQLGQAVDPSFLFNLFSRLGSAMPQGIANLFTNTGTPLGSRAASPSSYMQMLNQANNDNSTLNFLRQFENTPLHQTATRKEQEDF